MVSSSRFGSPASTPQDQDKEADCEAENRTDINHSLPASYVPEESADSTTEQVQGQCMQLSETQHIGPGTRSRTGLYGFFVSL